MRKRVPRLLAGLLTLGLPIGVAAVSAGSAAAATTPGSLDPTFGNGGKVVTKMGVQGVPSDAVLQPNGDIVVSGGFGVARYLPSGQLDRAFGAGGLAQTGFTDFGFGPTGVAVQPDGKIVWVGDTTTQVSGGDVADFAIARFNANGTLDSGFGKGGQVTTEFFAPPLAGALELANAVLVQPDGKLLVGGTARQGQLRTNNPQRAALVRLNANGTLDTSFGNGGRVLSAGLASLSALGLDAAGDIFTLPTYAEFSPSGQPDASVTPAAITSSSHGGAAAFLASGQFVIATTVGVTRHDTDVQVQRFNPGGTIASTSPAFDYTGQDGNASDFPGAVAVQANGQAVAGGGHFLGTDVFGLARINSGGSLDLSFGSGGTLTTFIQGNDSVGALVVQPDGKIIAVGLSEDNSTGQVDVALVRYLN
jgi:uncharacterized delta-60 repeat protein